MFSFHKPKVYRSPTGCCICRAKSSSSRFTDSKKYEDDFMECFQLKERRAGEICNACVLLVKRWKKLPEGSERNWRHVVDARAGPGTKSLTKFKSKNKKKLKMKADTLLKVEKVVKKKHVYVKSERIVRETSPGACSDDITGEDFLSDMSGPSMSSSLAPSPTPFDNAVPLIRDKSPTRLDANVQAISEEAPALSSFLDMTYWKSERVCCGTIFRGECNEVMIDARFLKPCAACTLSSRKPPSPLATTSSNPAAAKGKTYSDSSSDSGYDESSNPGLLADATRLANNVTNNPLAEFAMHAANQCLQLAN